MRHSRHTQTTLKTYTQHRYLCTNTRCFPMVYRAAACTFRDTRQCKMSTLSCHRLTMHDASSMYRQSERHNERARNLKTIHSAMAKTCVCKLLRILLVPGHSSIIHRARHLEKNALTIRQILIIMCTWECAVRACCIYAAALHWAAARLHVRHCCNLQRHTHTHTHHTCNTHDTRSGDAVIYLADPWRVSTNLLPLTHSTPQLHCVCCVLHAFSTCLARPLSQQQAR